METQKQSNGNGSGPYFFDVEELAIQRRLEELRLEAEAERRLAEELRERDAA